LLDNDLLTLLATVFNRYRGASQWFHAKFFVLANHGYIKISMPTGLEAADGVGENNRQQALSKT
jgi:hypothetical protein